MKVCALTLLIGLSVISPQAGWAEVPASAPPIQLYGFGPFGDFDVNPTADLVDYLIQGHPDRGASVLSVQPPDALAELFEIIDRRPKVLIGFGVRADVRELEVNVEATNWLSMRVEGELPYFGLIEPGLPAALPLPSRWRESLETRLGALNIPHTLSSDAGMHACNLSFFYGLLHAPRDTRVLFMHVPPDVLTRPGYLQSIEQVIEVLTRP